MNDSIPVCGDIRVNRSNESVRPALAEISTRNCEYKNDNGCCPITMEGKVAAIRFRC